MGHNRARPTPNTGGFVNGITYLFENPCDNPWTVYFETAKEPGIAAGIALIAFGADDVIRGYFRPKGLRGGRHGRKRKHRPKGAGRRRLRGLRPSSALPEIGEMIGKRLPGAEDARGRRVTQGVKTLWILDGYLQRLLFYYMIYDVGRTFIMDWSSNLRKFDGAACRNHARMLRKDETHDTWGGAGSGYGFFNCREIEYQEHMSSTAVAAELGSGSWLVVAAAEVTAQPDWDPTVELAIMGMSGTGVNPAFSGPVTVPRNTSAELVVSATIKGPTIIGWRVSCDNGFVVAKEKYVTIHSIENREGEEI